MNRSRMKMFSNLETAPVLKQVFEDVQGKLYTPVSKLI